MSLALLCKSLTMLFYSITTRDSSAAYRFISGLFHHGAIPLDTIPLQRHSSHIHSQAYLFDTQPCFSIAFRFGSLPFLCTAIPFNSMPLQFTLYTSHQCPSGPNPCHSISQLIFSVLGLAVPMHFLSSQSRCFSLQVHDFSILFYSSPLPYHSQLFPRAAFRISALPML